MQIAIAIFVLQAFAWADRVIVTDDFSKGAGIAALTKGGVERGGPDANRF